MKTADVKRIEQPMDRLLYWIKERESIRIKRSLGLEPPWTDDEILQRYRFCNVRRMDDKVSQWLLKSWYKPFKDHPNMVYAVALARFVNLPLSLVGLSAFLFEETIDWDCIITWLRSVKENEGVVFNGAYMVRGNSTKSQDKIETVVSEYIGSLVRSDVKVNRSSMQETHAQIKDVYGFGSFMAGQIVSDLRWAITGTWADKNSWAPIGPGSSRGMKRLGETDLMDTIGKMRLGVNADTRGRLEAMDYQNCLCEFDKYERALWGEGKPKQLYRGAS